VHARACVHACAHVCMREFVCAHRGGGGGGGGKERGGAWVHGCVGAWCVCVCVCLCI